jgi:hypothetical protein
MTSKLLSQGMTDAEIKNEENQFVLFAQRWVMELISWWTLTLGTEKHQMTNNENALAQNYNAGGQLDY